jgi:hypothetical protein
MNGKSPIQFLEVLRKSAMQRGTVLGVMLIGALLMFEIFNYSTTDFALNDVLGDTRFLGVRWATILALAFCGIDFAGLARLFTPEQGRDEPVEVWYLFGAWILAAAMNAILTWWGVSVATANHIAAGSAIIGRETLVNVVPVFVAVMVWVIRILIIGTFSVAGERIFSVAADDRYAPKTNARPQQRPAMPEPRPVLTPRPQPRPVLARSEPTYHPVGVTAKAPDQKREPWR